jgi:hypothetical protein
MAGRPGQAPCYRNHAGVLHRHRKAFHSRFHRVTLSHVPFSFKEHEA